MTSGKFSGGVGPWSDKVGPDLKALRERFWNYTPVDRDHERRGLLAWDSDPELNCSAEIHISEHPNYGFAIMWCLSVPKGMMGEAYYTVGDKTLMTDEHWIDAGDQDWVLEGNFVSLETAWAVIEDFFGDPLTLSKRAEWVNTEDMPEFPI